MRKKAPLMAKLGAPMWTGESECQQITHQLLGAGTVPIENLEVSEGTKMLRDDADRHKGRWLLLVMTLMAVLFGIAFARYAFHHQPIRHSIANSNR